jgi:hypothetical protein
MQTITELKVKIAKLEGKEEMIDKYHDSVTQVISSEDGIREKLKAHMKDQDESIRESTKIYLEASAKSEENAKKFCQDKTLDELKTYLADRPVSYNSWKNADHDTLVELVSGVYDE